MAQVEGANGPSTSLLADTWLVVPLYNEAPVVREVIAGARAVFPRIVVVDEDRKSTRLNSSHLR